MKIVKVNKLANGLVEAEFDNGAKSQYREEDLAEKVDGKPEDFKAQVKEQYGKDKGTGKDAGAGKETK